MIKQIKHLWMRFLVRCGRTDPLSLPDKEDIGFKFIGGDGGELEVGGYAVHTQPWFNQVFNSEVWILSRPWHPYDDYVTVWMESIRNGVRGESQRFCVRRDLLAKKPLPIKLYDAASGFGIDYDVLRSARSHD